MAVGIVLGILLFLGAAACFVIGGYQKMENDNNAFCGVLCTIGAVLAIAFILVPFSFHTVDTGEIA